MEKTAAGGVEAEWDAAGRRLHVRFRSSRETTYAQRRELAARLRAWTGPEGDYTILVDGRGKGETDVPFHMFWGEALRPDRRRVRLAFHNIDPAQVRSLDMLGNVYGLQARAFPDEASARAWLDEDR